MLNELAERTASIERKMDIWIGRYQYDEGGQEHEAENDLEEGLTRVIDGAQGAQEVAPSAVEVRGAMPGRVFDLAAHSPRQQGEQEPADNGWYDMDPMRPATSAPPSFGAEGLVSQGLAIASLGVPPPGQAANHWSDLAFLPGVCSTV